MPPVPFDPEPVPAAAATTGKSAPAPADDGGFTAVTPARLLDTRNGTKPANSTTTTLAVAGHGGVPASGAVAVQLTVTVTAPDRPGFVTAYPCGGEVPTASNVNYSAGQTIPNAVTVRLDAKGQACLFNSASTHLVVDVTGWYGPGTGRFAAVTPSRVVDTRQSGGALKANGVLTVPLAGQGGVPGSGVTAVALNVTATNAEHAGYLTVYPCGTTPPLASTVNVAAGGTAASAAAVGLAGDGSVCIYASTRTDVVVDVDGWFGSGATGRLTPITPQRRSDTRTTNSRLAAGGEVEVLVGTGGPVALNVTVTDPALPGFLSVYPCGKARPVASNVNYGAGQTIANAALVAPGSDGGVCVFSSAAAHVVVDLDGTFSSVIAPGIVGAANAQAAIDWGLTQVGSPYAALNPYRFGDSTYGKPWDCALGEATCTKVDMHGTARTVMAGDYVYDCSGFVVAAWLHAGVDLVKKNAAWTDPMLLNLPHVPRADAKPGDLVLFNYSGHGDEVNGQTDHVGLYLNDKQMLQAGSCPTGSGVCIRNIDWTKVVAVSRPG
jgi:hypothetical protein